MHSLIHPETCIRLQPGGSPIALALGFNVLLIKVRSRRWCSVGRRKKVVLLVDDLHSIQASG